MTEYLGLITAIVVLIAALFGLIPPLLSGSPSGSKSDEAVAGLLDATKPFLVIGAIILLFFTYMYLGTNITRFMAPSHEEPEVSLSIKNLSDGDINMVLNADLISSTHKRNDALGEIVEHALKYNNAALATLAASEISATHLRNEMLLQVHMHSLKSGEVEQNQN